MSKSYAFRASDDSGPFDIIGDVHGCARELNELLFKLGYSHATDKDAVDGQQAYTHPQGRRVIFVGDVIDRGPAIVETLNIVMQMVETGNALCVIGNHEYKLMNVLRETDIDTSRILSTTLRQFDDLSESAGKTFRRKVAGFIEQLPFHYVLDGNRLIIAHAGLVEHLQGQESAESRDFALFGIREKADEETLRVLPSRAAWVLGYQGAARVVYGHTPVSVPEWRNNTLCIDTGCVYGGALSALRYPELEIVSIPAHDQYAGGSDRIWNKPQTSQA